MFDIYAFNKLENSPEFVRLRMIFPDVLDANISSILTENYHPRFLGLEISETEAIKVFSHLQKIGLRGRVVKSAYRKPAVSIEQAQPIAEKECQRLIEIRHQTKPFVEFKPAAFTREDAMWWTFSAVSDELVEQGYIPGAVQVSVDKLDGHIWSTEEVETWLTEQEKEIRKYQTV